MTTPSSKVYLMDCMDLMKQYPDNHFELAICDPEYGINVNHNIGRRKGMKPSKHKKVTWDKQPPPVEYFNELFRISQNQIVWGANHFISRMPFDSSCWLMWDRGFSEDVTFAQFELAWTSFDSTCKKFDKHPSQPDKIHPTQKPVKLYEWLLHNYAKQGDKIFDSHLGSQSSRIAAHKLGFDFVGSELDPDYFKDGCKRFEQYKSQLVMQF